MKPDRPHRWTTWLLAIAMLAIPAALAADVVVLKDGKRIEGEVTDIGDAYKVTTKYGTLTFPKGDVEAVEKEKAVPMPPRPVDAPPAADPEPPPTPPDAPPAGDLAAPVAPARPPARAATAGLVLHYPFDGDATDASGNGHHGKIHGTPAATEGRVGGALAFDGTGHVAIPAAATAGLKRFTIALWMRTPPREIPPPSAFWRHPTLVGSDSAGLASGDLGLFVAKGHAGYYHGLAAGHDVLFRSDVPIADDRWHHVALANDGERIRLYVDGRAARGEVTLYGQPEPKREPGGATPSGQALLANPFFIGATDASGKGDCFFQGLIDDVRIYGRALAADEVGALAAHAAGPRVLLPVPDLAARNAAGREFRKLFRAEYAKRDAESRLLLARKLLEIGGETVDDDAVRYAAWHEAQDLAAEGGDLGTALAAIGRLGAAYDVDASALKVAAVKSSARTRDPKTAASVYAAGRDLVERLADADDYDTALGVATPLADLARRLKDPGLVREMQERTTALRSAQAAWNRVRASVARLEEDPDDAEACLAVGRYRAAERGDWEAALPLLARCSHAGLKEAAAADLADPKEAAARVAVGDRWYALAGKETGDFKAAIRERALECYERALPGLEGLEKVRVEKRIGSLTKGSSRGLNLLAMADPARHAVSGAWKAEGRALVSDAGLTTRLMFPYEVPKEYDYRVDLTRMEGASTVCLILTKDGREFVMEMGWPGGEVGFAYVDGKHIDANPTGAKFPVTNGRRYRILVQVRNRGLKAYLDGRLLISWRTDYTNVTPHSGWVLPNKKCVGIGSHGSPTAFHAAELIEVTGRGRRVR